MPHWGDCQSGWHLQWYFKMPQMCRSSAHQLCTYCLINYYLVQYIWTLTQIQTCVYSMRVPPSVFVSVSLSSFEFQHLPLDVAPFPLSSLFPLPCSPFHSLVHFLFLHPSHSNKLQYWLVFVCLVSRLGVRAFWLSNWLIWLSISSNFALFFFFLDASNEITQTLRKALNVSQSIEGVVSEL